MEQSLNLKILEAKDNIVKAILSTQLPATILQMIVAEIKLGIDQETAQIIQREKEEYIKAMETLEKQTD